jgi:hypothetical protein
METLLIVALAVLAIVALVVWWICDIDVADVVASFAPPLAGVWLIYRYGTVFAWVGGLVLLGIGGFALYYLVKRRSRAGL